MEAHQIWEIVRRARLRVVPGTSDKNAQNVISIIMGKSPKEQGNLPFFASAKRYTVNFENDPNKPKKRKYQKSRIVTAILPHAAETSESSRLCKQAPGPTPASKVVPVANSSADDDAEINLIANATGVEPLKDNEIPTDSEFEILRLRRRVLELECITRDRDDRVVKALGMIEDELSFWRSYLHDHIRETMAGVSRRVGRLESTLDYLKEKGSRFYPPLEIPAAWKRKG